MKSKTMWLANAILAVVLLALVLIAVAGAK